MRGDGPRMRLREGSPLALELSTIQWARTVSATGRLVEDPSIPNDTADAALYAHRHAWHHRYRPGPPRPAVGSDEYHRAEEQRMTDAAEEDDLEVWH